MNQVPATPYAPPSLYAPASSFAPASPYAPPSPYAPARRRPAWRRMTWLLLSRRYSGVVVTATSLAMRFRGHAGQPAPPVQALAHLRPQAPHATPISATGNRLLG